MFYRVFRRGDCFQSSSLIQYTSVFGQIFPIHSRACVLFNQDRTKLRDEGKMWSCDKCYKIEMEHHFLKTGKTICTVGIRFSSLKWDIGCCGCHTKSSSQTVRTIILQVWEEWHPTEKNRDSGTLYQLWRSYSLSLSLNNNKQNTVNDSEELWYSPEYVVIM